MKIATVLLTGSALLNAAFIGVIAAGLATKATPSARSDLPQATTPTPSNPSAGPTAWSTLEDADLAKERDRLRAEGFPPQLLRAILSAQISERDAARRKALEPADVDHAFWRRQRPDPQAMAALRDLNRAERKELEDLVGPDPEHVAGERFIRQIPGLTPDKAEELQAITDRYNRQRQDLFSRGPLDTGAQQSLQDIDRQMHAEFAAVLTPEQLEEYDLRASRTAQQLQYSLAVFDPSEAEYRALYKLQSAFDQQFQPTFGAVDPTQMRARTDAYKQLQSDIAAALGPQRYAEYQRDTDYSYRTTTQLVARLQMPPETADNLYAIQKDYQQKVQDVYRTAREAGSPGSTWQQLSALQQEATAKVATALGGNATAVEAYKTYGGQWLSRMVPSSQVRPGPGMVFRPGP